jgi:hypothetical protein
MPSQRVMDLRLTRPSKVLATGMGGAKTGDYHGSQEAVIRLEELKKIHKSRREYYWAKRGCCPNTFSSVKDVESTAT